MASDRWEDKKAVGTGTLVVGTGTLVGIEGYLDILLDGPWNSDTPRSAGLHKPYVV
jgi:hypothetical protein